MLVGYNSDRINVAGDLEVDLLGTDLLDVAL